MPFSKPPQKPGAPPEPRTPRGGRFDTWTSVAERLQFPHLDHLMRAAAADLCSFPRLFIDATEHGPVTGEPLTQTIWWGRDAQQLDYGAIIKPGPGADSGLDAWAINIEFITHYNRKRLSALLKRHCRSLRENIPGAVRVDPFVLAVGSRVPKAESVLYDNEADGTPLHAPLKHIGHLYSTMFSAADQELAIFKIVAIMMADGQSVAAVNRAVEAVFAEPNPHEFAYLFEKLFALADGRPEYRDWIMDACRREDQKMPAVVREQRRELALDSFLRDSPFRDAFQARAQEKGRKEGRKEGQEEGIEIGKHQAHVTALLSVLRRRGIELSPTQKVALQGLKCAALPEMAVAVDAADADDFARLARLPAN